MNKSEQLIDKAIAILQSVPLLATRRNELASLGEQSGSDDLHVGVIGITSSGKSTFINGLMGESLLPEEARATTNLLVKCRYGSEREARLYFRDGNSLLLRGHELTKEKMGKLCSEKLNPGNRAELSRIEWTTPTSCIPPGLVLVDTPGLDAEGLQEHQDITLRQFLPLADIVIYMTSIRNPFKAADLQAVGTVLENDQRVLFLLSQIDLERDSHEGGLLVKSRSEKLKRHRYRLETDLARIPGLRSYGVELVSSYWAKKGFGNRAGAEWNSSRFSVVLDRLSEFAVQLKDLVAETRTARVRVQLGRTIKELEQAEKITSTGIVGPDEKRSERITSLSGALEMSRTLVNITQRETKRLADPSPHHRKVSDGTSNSKSIETIEALYREIEQKVSHNRDRLVSSTDAAQAELRSSLEGLGIVPARAKAAVRRLGAERLPDVGRHISTEERRERTRDWFDDWAFWPKSETRLVRTLDVAAAIRVLETFIERSGTAGNDFVDWWQEFVGVVFIEPVQVELDTEIAAARDLESLIQEARRQTESIRAARVALANLLEKKVSVSGISPLSEDPELVGNQPTPQPPAVHAGTPLRSLLAAFRELEFQRTFERLLAPMRIGDAPLLALGRDRSAHLRLMALLAHDLHWLEVLESVPSDQWIMVGESPVKLPGIVHRVDAPDSFLERIPMILAPPDDALPVMDWPSFLGEFSALIVEVDAPRIGAGLADLARAPYRQALDHLSSRLMFSCGNGAFFAENRFGELIRDVLPELEHSFGTRPFFVYEDYDPRHTSLIELHADAVKGGNPRQLPRIWRDERLHFAPPFSEAALQELAIALHP